MSKNSGFLASGRSMADWLRQIETGTYRHPMPPIERVPTVYVAGAYADRSRVVWVMERLRKIGFRITCDWVAAIDESAKAGIGSDRELDELERLAAATADLKGIDEADFVLFLAPMDKRRGIGAWVELGYAIGGFKIVVGSGENVRHVVFGSLVDHAVGNDVEAVDVFVTILKSGMYGKPS